MVIVCVFIEVSTECLNIIKTSLGCAMAQGVSCQPLSLEAQVHDWVSPCGGFVMGKVALGQVFL
jgi:hypothetical protein